MSFSSMTKNELARIPVTDHCCKLAELAAILECVELFKLKDGGETKLRLITENTAIARRILHIKRDV